MLTAPAEAGVRSRGEKWVTIWCALWYGSPGTDLFPPTRRNFRKA